MILQDIIDVIEQFAPPQLQESYDNAGLIVGDANQKITGALLCLDSTEDVVQEAIDNNINLIIAHHPIIFNGLKRITGRTYVERTVIKAIKNNIAIYSAHTNLDNVYNGVNKIIANKIGLINTKILSPKSNTLKKLVTFCPLNKADEVRAALFAAGAGKIGNYDNCSFNINGAGTFKAGENTNPYVGNKGELHTENETRIEVVFQATTQSRLITALLKSHPYEEVAYDIYSLDNSHPQIGSGLIGELNNEMDELIFLKKLKSLFNVPVIKHTNLLGKKIKHVAICGGSGSFLLKQAISAQADIFISADFKYHEYFDADGKILIADIGHFENEQFTQEIFYNLLTEKFPKFAVRFTKTNTNPVNYI